MSYGEDQYMFTKGQMVRARAVFAEGGPRHSMITRKKSTDDDHDDDHDDTFYIIIGVLTIFSVFFLTVLVLRSLIKCFILKYQLREMNRIEEVSPEELLT
jgi:hypothetical protein